MSYTWLSALSFYSTTRFSALNSPITTLTFRNYYATIPKEIIEAARMDGADLLKTYRYIILPVSIPRWRKLASRRI